MKEVPAVDKVTNADLDSVSWSFNEFLMRQSAARRGLPVFALGASSGGTFVSILSRAMYLLGAFIMISPGHPSAFNLPTLLR